MPLPVHTQVSFGKTLIPQIAPSPRMAATSSSVGPEPPTRDQWSWMLSHTGRQYELVLAFGRKVALPASSTVDTRVESTGRQTVTSSHAALTYGVLSHAALQFRVSVSITVSFVVWSFCDNTLPAALLPHSRMIKCESVWGQLLAVAGT